MSNCSSPGDSLNNWTSGCEHLGSSNNTKRITTFSSGGDSDYLWESGPVVQTSRGLGAPVRNDESIFGPGGTLGGSSSSSGSGNFNPSDKLNDWAPDGPSNSTLRPASKDDILGKYGYDLSGNTGAQFDQSSVKKLDKEVGTRTDVTSDSPENLTGSSGGQQQQSAPPSAPSTRPYVWKYQ